MQQATNNLDFEQAAKLRDRIKGLQIKKLELSLGLCLSRTLRRMIITKEGGFYELSKKK